MKSAILTLAMFLPSLNPAIAFAEIDLCRKAVERAVLEAESTTARGTYWNEDCEKECDLLTKVRIVSSSELMQKEIQPADLVGKYSVKTATLAKNSQEAEYIAIYRSFDYGRCTILRLERVKGLHSLPHDVLEQL